MEGAILANRAIASPQAECCQAEHEPVGTRGAVSITTHSDLEIFLPGCNGHGVLLLHGATGAPAEMKFVARSLNKSGYTVYAPLLAGHGGNLATLRRSRWEDWAESARDAAHRLSPRVSTLSVAGICVGGLLGLELSVKCEAVKAAVVYSPALRYDGWNVPFYYHLGPYLLPIMNLAGLTRWVSLQERPPYGIKSDRIRRLAEQGASESGIMPAFPGETLYQTHRLFHHVKRLLPKIRTRTLIIRSSADDLASEWSATQIEASIGGRCRTRVLHDSYHMIHVDQERARVAQWTREFFEDAGA